MNHLLNHLLEKSSNFIPHGHCYLWIPSLLWLHVISDLLIGIAYIGISLILYVLVRKIRLPFSPIFIAFGLFIGLCGITHFMKIWTVWNPDYWLEGIIKAGTAAASVATAIGLFFVKPQVEEVVNSARLSEERRTRLESAHAELELLYKKVREMDELKTQFFANISHELRTPLALILGPVQHLLSDPSLSSDQRRHIESIGTNGKSLLKHVNDLLDISKLEAGKMEVHYVQVDLAASIRQICSRFEVLAELREVRFDVDAPESLPAQVDPDMFGRIVVNLLSNAFKFTPAGGAISVLVNHDDQNFSLRVADSGPGVIAQQREAIFERFRQVDGGATRSHGGTGLGLAIAKDFIQLHGGTVNVGTSEAGGALFEVTLPLQAPEGIGVAAAKADDNASWNAPRNAPRTESRSEFESESGNDLWSAADAVTAAAPRPFIDHAIQEIAGQQRDKAEKAPRIMSPDRPTVLIVEDTRGMRDFIVQTLEHEYNILEAEDGREGLAEAQAARPDLVITDMMMPNMSGEQLVEAIREDAALNAMPILLLTAKADDDLRVRLLRNGAQDYLTKPFYPDELQARAGNLVGMKRAGDTLRSALSSLSSDVAGLAEELGHKHSQLRIALEAAEVAKEHAERASQVKGQFLAMISHELRTPLSTIHMNMQLLSQDQSNQVPDALKPRMNRLSKAAQQMTTLVEGLLEYTRAEAGKISAKIEVMDPFEAAEEVTKAHAEQVPPGVALTIDRTGAPLVWHSDPRLVRVILSNLIANALKFTESGSVIVRAAVRDMDNVLEVADTGIGIAEEDLGRVFNPFEQLEPVRRKSVPGVGLGLALVKLLVEALGGRLEVSSKPGEGTRFVVLLPSGGARQAGIE